MTNGLPITLTQDQIQTDMDTANQSVDGSSRRFYRFSKNFTTAFNLLLATEGNYAPLFERGIAIHQ